MLDLWLSDDRVQVEGEEMITQPEGQRFALTTAVYVKEEVSGGPDVHGLVGKVKDLEQLTEMGAEHYADSILLDENAYMCIEGFAGTPVEAPVLTGSSLSSAAAAAVGERTSSGELDLLARFLQSE